jgi:flagellar basal-body rod protein FlgF
MMIRGFYTAAAGMLAQMQRQEMLTNNISNANTPGYKADQSSLRSFPNVLLSQFGGQDGNGNQIGGMATGVYMQEATPNFELGPLQATNVPTDVALVPAEVPVDPKTGRQGTLMFAVQGADGKEHYTRNGHFNVDALGRLTTADGNLVLSTTGQPITLSSNDFTINSDGRIYIGGALVSKIGVHYASDPTQLVKEGNGLFKVGGNGGTLPIADGNPAISYNVKQGFLEESNVSLDQDMTDLMMAYRTFEANQRVLKSIDHTMDLVANQVGRIG